MHSFFLRLQIVHCVDSVRVRVSTNCTAFFLAYTTSVLATETDRVRVVYYRILPVYY